MILQIILSVLCGIAFLAVTYFFFLIKEMKNHCAEHERSCKAHNLSCEIALESVEEKQYEQRFFFIRLKERYLHSLLLAVKKYKQSQKKKYRKFAFRTLKGKK